MADKKKNATTRYATFISNKCWVADANESVVRWLMVTGKVTPLLNTKIKIPCSACRPAIAIFHLFRVTNIFFFTADLEVIFAVTFFVLLTVVFLFAIAKL